MVQGWVLRVRAGVISRLSALVEAAEPLRRQKAAELAHTTSVAIDGGVSADQKPPLNADQALNRTYPARRF